MISILNLIICSDNDHDKYHSMYECLNKYCHIYEHHKNVYVKTYFMKYKDDIEGYELHDNILYMNGKESYVPGIILKTLKGFKYFENELGNYDYIVRSNLSTIIDFRLLAEELETNPIHFYGGGHKRNLQWTGGGIEDSTWFGTDYIEGTCIIFTPTAVKYVLDNIHLVRTNIIDDVSIAIFMREHASNEKVQDIDPSRYAIVPCFYQDKGINMQGIYNMIAHNFIFYRNKCCDKREIDVIQMNIIRDIIMHKEIKNVIL